MALKDLLKKELTKKQLALAPSSFDIIGSEKAIAIIEIPEALKKKEKIIARAIIQQHKIVSCVLKKSSPRKGTYRTRSYKTLFGRCREVVHIESGCRFLLNPKKVYFSPRECSERLRIADKIKPKETIMVFFAGIGSFVVVIAKKTTAQKVVGIEINKKAIDYFKRNIEKNKLSNVEVVLGDVKTEAKQYYGKCDRVLMPLPESADQYLEQAIKCLKPGGICHYYCFSGEKQLRIEKNKIKKAAEKLKKKIRILGTQKVLSYGPNIWKMRIDFRIS